MPQDSDSSKSERILEAAAKLMRLKSFKDISMDELAYEAGVAKGTLYLYFRSKGDIYLSLLVEKVNAFARVVSEVTREKLASSRQALERILEASHKAFAEKPRTQDVPIFAVPSVSPEEIEDDLQQKFFPVLNGLKMNLASVFKKGIESGEFRPLDPERLAGLFMHLLEYCYVHPMILSDTPTDPALEMVFVKDILIKGIMA